MSDISVSHIDIDGHAIRVWRKGAGPVIGCFAGWGGLPRWTPFLDALSRQRTVVAPSLPGFPGGGRLHLELDAQLDWVVATRRIFSAAGLEGADLIGANVGAALAAEVAALWPASVRRLALISPLGLRDERHPPADPFARRADEYAGFFCHVPQRWSEHVAAPAGHNDVEWEIEQSRAAEAAARLLWPIADTRLARRAPMIQAPTLLLRGAHDRVNSREAMDAWARAIGARAHVQEIADAGHIAELDQPAEVARVIAEFMA